MQDPHYTRVLLVTLAETTPVHEAKQLQDDLRRADVEPFGWVINASLAARGTTDPVGAKANPRLLNFIRDDESSSQAT